VTKRKGIKHYDGPGAFATCRSCGDPIRFLLTNRGRLMPTNAAEVRFEETHFDHTRHTSHFATCKQADMWRKPWRKEGAPEGAP
jgi:hypothetical protein